MLLKTNFVPVAPDGYFDRLWPSVEQRLDDDPESETAGAGGGKSNGGAATKAKAQPEAEAADGDEVVFHSSAALKVLNIPDKSPKQPEPRAAAPAQTASAPVPQPEPAKSGGYAWPIAFVLAAGIATGGFLYYKKQNEKHDGAVAASGQRTGTIGAPGASENAGAGSAASASGVAAGSAAASGSADAMAVASAAGATGDAGAGAVNSAASGAAASGAGAGSASGDDDGAKAAKGSHGSPTRVASRRRRARRRVARAAAARAKPASAAKPKAKKKAETAGAAPAKKRGGKGDSLNALIDGALGGKAPPTPKKKAAKSAPDPSLPKQLNMNQIRTVMRKIRGRVQGCYDKYQIEGKATARVSIAPSGRVKNVVIKGKFFGTDTGTCVAKAVRRARFPKFSGKTMTIKYPFLLQ